MRSPGRRRAARPRPAPAAPRPRGFPGARRPAVSATPLLAGRVRSRAPRRLGDRGGGRRQSNRPRAMSSPAVARRLPGREPGGGLAAAEAGPVLGSGRRLAGGDRRSAPPRSRSAGSCCSAGGELLALGGHLKGALEAYAAALRRGAPVRPECLGTLVDCLVFNYRLRHGLGWSASPAGGAHRGVSAGGLLSCLGCRGFLSEPVTVPCGHSYCRRCLRRELRALPPLPGPACRPPRLPMPRDLPAAASGRRRPPPPPPPPPPPASRTGVVLSHLAEKWFPGQRERARAAGRLGELLHQGRYREALAACTARSCEQVSAQARDRTLPSQRAGRPQARLRPRPAASQGLRLGVPGCVCFGGCVWEGAAPRGASVTMDRPRADCDAARGFPTPRPGAVAGAPRVERRGAEWPGEAARARDGEVLGEPERRLASCRALSGNWPWPESAAGDSLRGGKWIPSRGWACNVYTLVSRKSHRGGGSRGRQNCISRGGWGWWRALCNG